MKLTKFNDLALILLYPAKRQKNEWHEFIMTKNIHGILVCVKIKFMKRSLVKAKRLDKQVLWIYKRHLILYIVDYLYSRFIGH